MSQMKIGAITVWMDRVSPVFESATSVLVVSKDKANTVEMAQLSLKDLSIQQKIELLRKHGVVQLVCGAISKTMEETIHRSGIDVISFCSGRIEKVLHYWLCGQIRKDELLMPGCRCRKRRQRNRGQNRNRETRLAGEYGKS